MSSGFPSVKLSQQELFDLASQALKEEGYDVVDSNPTEGVIIGSITPNRLRNVEGASADTLVRNIATGQLFIRVDVQKPDQGESLVSVNVKKSSPVLPGDPYALQRDFLYSYKLRVEKYLAGKPIESKKQIVDPVDQLPTLIPGPKRRTNGYAVLIGVESYRDLPKVDFAQRDVETIKGYLINALGYPEDHIMVRTNERATRSDFESYLERWLENNVEKGSEVFIYYSGHGSPHPKSGQPFLVPFDGDPQYLDKTAYPVERLYQTLAKLPAERVVVVLDSCFSGTGGRSIIAKGARPVGLAIESPSMPTMAGKKMVVFSASQNNQVSSAFPEKQHGLFTYYFLKGFQGSADKDSNGLVSVGELQDYVRTEVQRQSRKMNSEQTPQITTAGGTQAEMLKMSIVDLPR
jgi:Caspase domain